MTQKHRRKKENPHELLALNTSTGINSSFFIELPFLRIIVHSSIQLKNSQRNRLFLLLLLLLASLPKQLNDYMENLNVARAVAFRGINFLNTNTFPWDYP